MHSTDNLDDGYLGSGKRLGYSLAKHGKESHTKQIVEMCNSREALKLREKELITDEMRNDPACMNIAPGGGGGLNNLEHARKFHQAGYIAMMKNKDLSKAAKNNWSRHREKMLVATNSSISIAQIAAVSEATRSKRKQTMADRKHAQGSKNSQFGTCWVSREGITLKIRKDDLAVYIAQGYVNGRK
jgi:hypothetical protein